MFNKRTLSIRARLLAKSFLLTTVLIPVFLIGILAVQTFLVKYQGNEKYNLEIVSAKPEITDALNSEFQKNDDVKKGSLSLSFSTLDSAKFEDYLAEVKPQILNKKISGVVYIPSSALYNKDLQFYSLNPNNISLFNKLNGTINKVLVDIYFSGKELSSKEIAFARDNVDFTGFKVSEKSTFENRLMQTKDAK